MNVNKCCYTIFSGSRTRGFGLDLTFNGESIPYNQKPVFLGIIFDEHLSFKEHFANLRVKALKRINIIKIFSHKSWHLNKKTLTNIYRTLIGSLFDYSFFAISCVSISNINLIQTIQNKAIRCIHRLEWDSPTSELQSVGGVLPIRERLFQLGARYLAKSIKNENSLICPLISEYFRSYSAITANGNLISTPLCYLTTLISIAYALLVFIVLCYYFL